MPPRPETPLGKALSQLRACSWRERGLLLEAAFCLAAGRLAVLSVPFKRIASRLGKLQAVATVELTPRQTRRALRIAWAVAAIARRTPWQSNCLTQAIAGKAMLRRRGIPSTLYLGVAKLETQPERLIAHAWVGWGERFFIGGDGRQRFTVISTFAEED
jgi:hypothetical protein